MGNNNPKTAPGATNSRPMDPSKASNATTSKVQTDKQHGKQGQTTLGGSKDTNRPMDKNQKPFGGR